MVNLLIFYVGFLLIKAVILTIPTLLTNKVLKTIPYRRYTAEEIIKTNHMRPDLFYKQELISQEALPLKNRIASKDKIANTYREADIDAIRERFKKKMQSRELTRNQIIAIRHYLEQLVDCKEKKFSNDCHCIYYCLKRLTSEQMLDMTALENLLK